MRHVEFIQDVSPLRLEQYLRSTGWKLAEHLKGKANIWHRPEEKHFDLEILQPIDENLRDYLQRLSEAIRILVEYENRSSQKIIKDISNFNSDIVKIRVISSDVENGAIPLDDGVLLFEKAKDLLVSTTLSTFAKKRFFSGSWPVVVTDFMRSLKFGQTERGSYIVSVLAPITPFSDNSLPDTESSLTRAVSTNLARCLAATKQAIESYEKNNNLLSFDNAVTQGVSANLCDAIIGMSGSSRLRDIEISIELALVEQDTQQLPKVHTFSSNQIPFLKTASEYFKGNFVIKNFEVSGLVVRMDHEASDDFGIIRVAANVHSVERNIAIQLTLSDYWMAFDAHKAKNQVICFGDLHVTPRSASLLNPRDFRVIDNLDLFEDLS
jgi:hypothetical protein